MAPSAHLFGPVVADWCRRAGLHEQDAADVQQEVFAAVARGVAQFHRDRPGDSFRGWLWGITQNKLRDYWRRRADQPRAAGGSDAQERLAQIAFDESGKSSASAGRQRHGQFRRALECLRAEFEDRTWQAFWRVTVDGEAVADVAAQLKMTASAVYVAKSRVLRRLRDEFGDLTT
jgi:RNA polymerase sigma-70 factor, ECF subfamily